MNNILFKYHGEPKFLDKEKIRKRNALTTLSLLILFVIFLFISVIYALTPNSGGLASEPVQHPPELLKLAEEFRAMKGYSSRRWTPG
jgi:hypothetical protein